MSEVLINEKTYDQLLKQAKKLSHAVIVNAPAGTGGDFIAQKLIDFSDFKVYAQELSPKDQKTIGIEQVRESLGFLRIKTADSDAKRILIIHHAETMTEEAQNALLKTLEEPAANSFIVLITEKLSALLPTIHSRASQLDVLPITFDQAKSHYPEIDQTELKKLFAISGGNAELLQALIDETDHPLKVSLESGKTYLKQSLIEKLATAESGKENADELVGSLLKISKSALGQKNVSTNQRKLWIRVFEASAEAQKQLDAYVSKKAVLTNLALQISQV